MADRARHLEATHYESLRDALSDADRVITDLLETINGQLVVPAESVHFLARRARVLVRSCADAIPDRAG